MSQIVKIGGQFATIGDSVTLTKPANASQVALRLYEPTQEIAMFFVTDPTQLHALQSDPTNVAEVPRKFVAMDAAAEIPASFIKYIGALGLKAEAGFIEAYIIEVTPE